MEPQSVSKCAVSRSRERRFAVLLCTHNGEAYLSEQLQSLVSQELPPSCLFVHDWGSTDGTRAIIERQRVNAGTNCTWIVVHHDEAPGPSRSFTSALLACLASPVPFDYLFLCDQDDIWYPQKVRCFAEEIDRRPELDLVYCDVKLIDPAGRVLADTYLGPGGAFGRPMDIHHPATMFVNTVSGMSMAMSRRFLLRGQAAWGLPDWFMHDWAMTIFASLTRAPVAFIPSSLVGYRQHAANLVGGLGGRGGRRSLASVLRQARADVAKTHRQYLQCVRLTQSQSLRPMNPSIGRFQVAATILRGRSFRVLKTLKVALGYALFWPSRG